MSTPTLLHLACTRVHEQQQQGQQPVVVVSALKGITDTLINLVANLRNAHGRATSLQRILQEGVADLHALHTHTLSASKVLTPELSQKLTNTLNELTHDLQQSVTEGLNEFHEAQILSYGERSAAMIFAHILNKQVLLPRYIAVKILALSPMLHRWMHN